MKKKQEIMTLAEREAAVDEHLRAIYAASDRMCQPMYPWVLVRVSQKSQETASGLHLPDNQNKTVHEGIVLATWKSHWRVSRTQDMYWQQSAVTPGDTVIFQHFAGVPFTTAKDPRYRFVKECDFATDREGGILAVINYEKNTTRDIIKEELALASLQDLSYEQIVRALEKRFVLVDRQTSGVTLSGV